MLTTDPKYRFNLHILGFLKAVLILCIINHNVFPLLCYPSVSSALILVKAIVTASLPKRNYSGVLLSNDIDLNMFEETKKWPSLYFSCTSRLSFCAHQTWWCCFNCILQICGWDVSGNEDFLQSLSLLELPDSNRFLFLFDMNPKQGVYTSPF